MASYQDDELQTLGDILPRMKPLPPPPPWADEDEQARTQQHNDALAQLQDNARVARHLAQNTITNGVPFPDSLLHFVPGRLVGPLAAARAGGNSDSWTDPSLTGSPNDTSDPWTSYAKSALTAGTQNSNAPTQTVDTNNEKDVPNDGPSVRGVLGDAAAGAGIPAMPKSRAFRSSPVTSAASIAARQTPLVDVKIPPVWTPTIGNWRATSDNLGVLKSLLQKRMNDLDFYKDVEKENYLPCGDGLYCLAPKQ
jgi:hypothetical protein